MTITTTVMINMIVLEDSQVKISYLAWADFCLAVMVVVDMGDMAVVVTAIMVVMAAMVVEVAISMVVDMADTMIMMIVMADMAADTAVMAAVMVAAIAIIKHGKTCPLFHVLLSSFHSHFSLSLSVTQNLSLK